MEKMPIVILIFYSIPESMVLLSLSSALYGYDVKANIKRLLYLSISLALVTYIVRYLPVKYGLNILIQLPIFVFLTSFFLKLNLRRSFVIILTGFIIIMATEGAVYPLISTLTGKSLGIIFGDIWFRLVMAWIGLLVLLSITILIIKLKFSFTSALHFFKTTTLNAKISLMIFVVLVQALLAGLIQTLFMYNQGAVWEIPVNPLFLQRIMGFALIVIPLISIFLLKRLFALSQQEAITATQEAFLANINNLFTTVRGQRHDFLNHVQVMYALLKSNKSDEAITYMDNLIDEIQEVSKVIKTKDPVLSALLNTKASIADRHKILLETDISSSLETVNIKSLDLVKILGNLLDNAIDAAIEQPSEFRKVKLSIKKFQNVIVFEVFNPRPVLSPEELDKLFATGYSTKQASGHSGLGLAVVKDITAKYNGQIGATSSDEKGTTFTVVIPI